MNKLFPAIPSPSPPPNLNPSLIEISLNPASERFFLQPGMEFCVRVDLLFTLEASPTLYWLADWLNFLIRFEAFSKNAERQSAHPSSSLMKWLERAKVFQIELN